MNGAMIKPYYDDGNGIVIYHGDCRDILPHLPKVDLVLTDPPYGVATIPPTSLTRSMKNDWSPLVMMSLYLLHPMKRMTVKSLVEMRSSHCERRATEEGMLKQKIDNGVKGSPGRFPRPRFCQFEECGKPTTGYKYCEEHAKIVKAQQQAEGRVRRRREIARDGQLDRRREINRDVSARKRDMAQSENDTRLAAIGTFKPIYTSSDLLHLPPEKAFRAINAILGGDAGLVR